MSDAEELRRDAIVALLRKYPPERVFAWGRKHLPGLSEALARGETMSEIEDLKAEVSKWKTKFARLTFTLEDRSLEQTRLRDALAYLGPRCCVLEAALRTCHKASAIAGEEEG